MVGANMKRCDEAQKLALMLRIARHKDHDAFRELFRDYEQHALALAFHITGRKDLAEDAVQEAMLRVWRLADSFREDRNGVSPWMARIVARESIKLISKGQRRGALETTSSELNPHPDELNQRNGMEHREEVSVLRKALAELPNKERRILALRYMGGMNQAEISELLSIPPRTISLRLKVALEKMKAKLATAGFSGLGILEGGLVAALQAGFQPSSGMASRIMEALPTQEKAANASTNGGSKKVWGASVGVMLLVAAAYGMIGWLRSPQAASASNLEKQVDQTAQNYSESSLEKIEATNFDPTSIEYSWQAKDGAPKDLEPHFGIWTWIPGKRVMRIGGKGVAVTLPIAVSTEPLLLEIRYRYPDNLAFASGKPFRFKAAFGLRWILKKRVWPQRVFKEPFILENSHSTHERTFYRMLYRQKQFGATNRKMNSGVSLIECLAPLPARFKLAVELQNMYLLSIRLISLDPKQLIPTFKDHEWTSVRSKIGAGKTVGWQSIPDKKPERDAKSLDPFSINQLIWKRR